MASDFDELELRARRASEMAYAPYSQFAVGAALQTADGRFFSGCNVENSSYGLTICAERAAVCNAVASGAREFLAIAIYTPTDRPAPPCGACCQVLAEFGPDMTIIATCARGEAKLWKLGELLPEAFRLGQD